jgi:hypothetical protein
LLVYLSSVRISRSNERTSVEVFLVRNQAEVKSDMDRLSCLR